MMECGLFDKEKWRRPSLAHPLAQLLYDAGVSARTKTAAEMSGFEVITSGIVRKSKESELSHKQRSSNFKQVGVFARVQPSFVLDIYH